jgi:hypothetical protein
MAVSLPLVVPGVRRNSASRAVGAIIGLDCVAVASLDRTDEGTEKGCGEMINMLNGSDQTPLFLVALQTPRH